MTNKTPRQKEILQVALELISQKGIKGLTIKNLSKKIGISEPAIYRHYEHKIDILVAILDHFKENTESLFHFEAKKDITAIEKIEQVFKQHFSTFAETPYLVSVIFAEELFKGEPALSKKIAEIINANNRILESLVNEGQNKGEIRKDIETSHLTLIIMGSLRLFIKKWQFSNYAFDVKKEGYKLIESIKCIIKNQ